MRGMKHHAALVLALTGVTSLRAQATASPSETEAAKKPVPSAKPVAAPAAEPSRARTAPARSRPVAAPSIAQDERPSSRPVPVERLQ